MQLYQLQPEIFVVDDLEQVVFLLYYFIADFEQVLVDLELFDELIYRGVFRTQSDTCFGSKAPL